MGDGGQNRSGPAAAVRLPGACLLAAVAACLMAAAFWFDIAACLAIPGLAIWALAVDPRLSRRWLLPAWLGVFLFVALSVLWLWRFHPAGPFLMGGNFGFYGVACALLLRGMVRWGAPLWLALPLGWVAAEGLARTASLFPSSWLHLGYLTIDWGPLPQAADVLGVEGLSLIVALLAGALAEVLVSPLSRGSVTPRARTWGLVAASGCVAAALVYGAQPREAGDVSDKLRVLLVQGNVPQYEKEDPARERGIFDGHLDLTRKAGLRGLDLVVWPETSASVYTDPTGETARQHHLTSLSRDLDSPLLVGARGRRAVEGDVRATNSVFLFEPGGSVAGRYDKVALVPFGEFVPFVDLFPTRTQDWIRALARNRFGVYPYMVAGQGPDPIFVRTGTRGFRAGVLICYEDVLPGLTAAAVRRGADLLVNPSNEAWYWPREMDQHLAMARMRAIENRRSLIRATNTGITAAIAPDGAVLARLVVDGQDRDVAGSLEAEVPISRISTLYSRIGPWMPRFVLPGAVLLALPGLVPRRRPPAGGSQRPLAGERGALVPQPAVSDGSTDTTLA